MTSWQKGNESEQEMEALGAFLELAQAIPTQTVMTTPVWQSVDLGWKPLETEKLHLDSSIRDIRDERGEKNVTSQMDGCVCKFIKQPLKKKENSYCAGIYHKGQNDLTSVCICNAKGYCNLIVC